MQNLRLTSYSVFFKKTDHFGKPSKQNKTKQKGSLYKEEHFFCLFCFPISCYAMLNNCKSSHVGKKVDTFRYNYIDMNRERKKIHWYVITITTTTTAATKNELIWRVHPSLRILSVLLTNDIIETKQKKWFNKTATLMTHHLVVILLRNLVICSIHCWYNIQQWRK